MKLEPNKCVYVIYNPEVNRTKVGISGNVKKRFYDLRQSAGCDLQLIHQTLPVISAELYERKVHEIMAKSRGIGEWFNIDPNEAKQIVEEAITVAERDGIVSDYIEGMSISDIAEKREVSRQAILNKLRLYGIYEKNRPPQFDKTKHREEARIGTIISKSEADDWIDIKFKDEVGNINGLKRLEPNINFNGTIYEINVFVSGVGFLQAYASDINRARAYVAYLKNGGRPVK